MKYTFIRLQQKSCVAQFHSLRGKKCTFCVFPLTALQKTPFCATQFPFVATTKAPFWRAQFPLFTRQKVAICAGHFPFVASLMDQNK
jgi:hypothetical protein